MRTLPLRRETADDADAIRTVHAAAFARPQEPGGAPPEAGLVDALRACADWLPRLSIVATDAEDRIVGHVVATRGRIDGKAVALGLGPLGVLPAWQRKGVGSALMYAVLGAADALDEPVVVLLGHAEYYPRFGFRPASEYGIRPPVAQWESPYFQARALTTYTPSIRGEFTYAPPFNEL